jgi:hypothetical protein
MRERKIFCIKIMGREAFFVPYTLGKTVAFPMLKEPIGYLLWVIFCDFFFLTFFLYVGKIMSYKKLLGMLGRPNKQITLYG